MSGEDERRREQAEAQQDHEQPSQERVEDDGPVSGGHEGHPHTLVREHMEVVGADGVHLGTVDAVDGERIKLTRADSPGAVEGQQGRHHFLPVGLVAAVEGNRVRLSANADVAYGMEEQE